MRCWWVNQNQAFRREIEGGYLWSPKRNKNGHRNPFYAFMREVAPGDIVFSFCDARIGALGIVRASVVKARSRRSSAMPAQIGARSAGGQCSLAAANQRDPASRIAGGELGQRYG